MREQVEREGRPYVIMQVVPGLHGVGSWDLVFQNCGRTMARELTAVVAGLAPQDSDDHIAEPLARFLSSPQALAPGARTRVMWRHEALNGIAAAGAEKRVAASLSYHDDRGHEFSDSFKFDVDHLGEASPVPDAGPTSTTSGNDLRNIDMAVRALSIHVGELRR